MKKILKVLVMVVLTILVVKSTDFVIDFTFYTKIFRSNTHGLHPEFMNNLFNDRIFLCGVASIVILISNVKPRYLVVVMLMIDITILIFYNKINNPSRLYFYLTNGFLTYRIWVWVSIIYCIYFSKYIKGIKNK